MSNRLASGRLGHQPVHQTSATETHETQGSGGIHLYGHTAFELGHDEVLLWFEPLSKDLSGPANEKSFRFGKVTQVSRIREGTYAYLGKKFKLMFIAVDLLKKLPVVISAIHCLASLKILARLKSKRCIVPL